MLRLDSSGRGLLNPNNSVLWDVDSGRQIWRGSIRLEHAVQERPGWFGVFASAEIDCDRRDRFETRETWYGKFASWSGDLPMHAVRNLRDGSLVYRCRHKTTTARVSSPASDLI